MPRRYSALTTIRNKARREICIECLTLLQHQQMRCYEIWVTECELPYAELAGLSVSTKQVASLFDFQPLHGGCQARLSVICIAAALRMYQQSILVVP